MRILNCIALQLPQTILLCPLWAQGEEMLSLLLQDSHWVQHAIIMVTCQLYVRILILMNCYGIMNLCLLLSLKIRPFYEIFILQKLEPYGIFLL